MAYRIEPSFENRYRPRFRFMDGPSNFHDYPNPLEQGRSVDPDEVPTTVVEESKFRKLPDFIQLPGCLAVCSKFKKIVEELEPKAHQFFQIALTRGYDGGQTDDYYLINILRRIDPIIFGCSDVSWIKAPSADVLVPHFRSTSPHLVLDKTKIEGCHMWKGGKYFSHQIFFRICYIIVLTKQK